MRQPGVLPGCGFRHAATQPQPRTPRNRSHGWKPVAVTVSNVTAARNPGKNGGTGTTPRTTTHQLSRSREHRVTAATGGNPWPSPVFNGAAAHEPRKYQKLSESFIEKSQVSMGPRLMSRGNEIGRKRASTLGSFNGAAAHGPRKSHWAQANTPGQLLLQWGRSS